MNTDFTAEEFDKLSPHPVQSFAWGEFRKKNKVVVERFLIGNKSYLVLFHKLPKMNFSVGVLTQSHMPDRKVVEKLRQLGKKHQAIFIKVEPYKYADVKTSEELFPLRSILKGLGLTKGKPLYPEYSFVVNLNQKEDELLANMKSKTRYNVRLAQKKNVVVEINSEDESFDEYLKLLSETTDRQKFFAHTKSYQLEMWKQLKKSGMAYVAKAKYKQTTLAAFVLFVFNNRLYYPYGASTRNNRGLMAPQLLMWEAMRFGKKMNCREFEMWGSLGDKPNSSHSWYGFHRFKSGYGGVNIEYVGAYDLVLNWLWYLIYQGVDAIRWFFLKKIIRK